MKLSYHYDSEVLRIEEKQADGDVEFDMKIMAKEKWEVIKEIQHFFAENDVTTDAMFYPYEDYHVKVIVRQDFYLDFLLQLLKYQLFDGLAWTNETEKT